MTGEDVTLIVRALLAAALGFAVGWERQAHGHAAGVRTVALVTLASAALCAIAQQVFRATPDRVVANIIVSVGFLGAGMILHGRRGEAHGLTTAATVWSMTIVGIIIGVGHYLAGVALTLLILLLLWWQHIPALKRLLPPTHTRTARIVRRSPQRSVTNPADEDGEQTILGAPERP